MPNKSKKRTHNQSTDTVMDRRAMMLINAAPNFFLALFGIVFTIKAYGWGSVFSFPYIILVLWLVFTTTLVIMLRWHEAKRETIEDKLDKLITELREDRIERNNKNKELPPID
jgi:uncharacterized membrane protein